MADPTPLEPEAQVAQIKADPKKPWKAIVGAVVTFVGLVWANLDGRTDFDAITRNEWIGAVLGAVIAFGAVYGIPNPLTYKAGAARSWRAGA
jgi:drug/metabolite transporter (DMT)-like permease